MNHEQYYNAWIKNHQDSYEELGIAQEEVAKKVGEAIDKHLAAAVEDTGTKDIWDDVTLKDTDNLWEKMKLAEQGAFPQKYVVGIGPDWEDAGTTDPKEDFKKLWSIETTAPKEFKSQELGAFYKMYAQQAAYYASGGYTQQSEPRVWERMQDALPEEFIQDLVACPHSWSQGDPCQVKYGAWEMVIHLNDLHKWDRERIANWLEESGNNPEFPVPEDVPKEPGEE